MSEAEVIKTQPVESVAETKSLTVVQPDQLDLQKRLDNTSPDIARRDALGQTVGVMDFLWTLAERVANTPLARKDRGKPDAVFAKMMRGYEVGLQPMQSLDAIEMIQDVPTLKPEVMLAVIRQHGHDYRWEERSPTKAVISAHRREWPIDRWSTFEYSIDDAKSNGLTDKDNWKKQPKVMLSWRVVAAMGRAEFADVLHGLSYVPDEILDSIETTATVVPVAEYVAPATNELTTNSEPEAATDEAKNGVREAIGKLSQEGQAELKEWWKPGCGLWAAGVDRLRATDVEPLLNKIQSIKDRARSATAVPPQSDTEPLILEIVGSPTPPSSAPKSSVLQDLDAVFEERKIIEGLRAKAVSVILGNTVERIEDLSDGEAETVLVAINGKTDAELMNLVLEAQ